jgi:hypothetical protein
MEGTRLDEGVLDEARPVLDGVEGHALVLGDADLVTSQDGLDLFPLVLVA